MSRKTSRLLIALPSAAAVLLLAACGGSDSKATSSSSAPAAASTSAASTTRPAGAGLDVAPPQALTPGAAAAAATKLNLNKATGDDYKRVIPNFPDRMVGEFLEYKPYVSIQQFRKEIGKYVGADQVAQWEKYVYVPVDPNKADADTLKQLPQVNDSIAGQLIAARPYANNDAFVTKLTQLVPGVSATDVRAMLS